MEQYTRSQMWDAVLQLAEISHSVASGNQRTMSRAFQVQRDSGLNQPEPPREVQVTPVAEQLTGRVIKRLT